MKVFLRVLFLFFTAIVFSQEQNVTYTVSPSSFSENDQITITISNINLSNWGVSDIYLWAWSLDANGENYQDSPTNGTWGNSNDSQKLSHNEDGTFSIVLTPSTFFNRTNIGEIGILVKAKNGTGDKKTQDYIFDVGDFPTVEELAVPDGLLDGINLDPSDNTKATLVLYAPLKNFVHLIGDFNNWQTDNDYLMKKDSENDRFWIELTGLSPQTNHLYQYLVDSEINIADPYSTLILDPYSDQYINGVTYPNLPEYPTDLTTEAVTVLRTGDTDYAWQTTNFVIPEKTDLVIYEILLRDFDAQHSFTELKNRLDYLQELGINAIELMPVSEFDGNESWGYNPSFHMALDKYYGTKEAFKDLIDECHSRGMAVILDVVYNHATGQNPYFRLWNDSNGGLEGNATAENPFFNQSAKHSYNVFNDYNHQNTATRAYVKRTSQYWINEFKIDGFRWDLTKGFTQNCTENDNSCTDTYQQDRVDVLKLYADYQWEVNGNFYVIFEHLGGIVEEKQWADYRVSEGKGILLWNKQNHAYNEATMGYNAENKSDFSGVSYKQKGFDGPSAVSFMESHDEERLMYKNLNFGNVANDYSVKDLNTSLARMQTAAAFFFTVPGPKMIWQFGELGYDISIDENGRVGNKPILWEYKNNLNRKEVYTIWSKLIKLKKNASIFSTTNFSMDVSNSNGIKKIHLTLDAATADEIKHIVVMGNFGTISQGIDPLFQETGTWYDLINKNTPLEVTNTSTTITLGPGEFLIYGSRPFEETEFEITAIPNTTVNENEPYTGPIPTLTGDTPIGVLTYTKGGSDSEKFTIDSLTGVVSMVGKDYENPTDAEVDNIYKIGIIATDSDENTATASWTVRVADDICPNTPFGATVNLKGCQIFTLVASNYLISTISETCRNSNNGKINISVVDEMNYTATVTGTNGFTVTKTFTDKLEVDSLNAGIYSICFTVDKQSDYKQCFDLVINEPEDLSVSSKIDISLKRVSLSLKGADVYFVRLNETTYKTSDKKLQLQLKPGINTISVETAILCQGKFEEGIFVSEEIKYFPNPVESELFIYCAGVDTEVEIAVYDSSGRQLYIEPKKIGFNRVIRVPTDKLIPGIYVVSVKGKTTSKNFKIIK